MILVYFFLLAIEFVRKRNLLIKRMLKVLQLLLLKTVIDCQKKLPNIC